MKPVIVVLAYNRPKAFKRLLDSLASAAYIETPKLIISLEGGATPETISLAKSFSTPALEVRVIERTRKLGLRDHVILCADLSLEFGSVIILEDDLIVDRYFYFYAAAALRFYESDSSVCGVALYAYEYNQISGFPFRPMSNGYSSYLMQVACSWGQCWTKSQWLKFKDWYKGKQSSDLDVIEGLPLPVKNWPESSWKKYFQGYMLATQTYFIYPYSGYSTNCSDSGGTHVRAESNLYQTSLATPKRPSPNLQFCPIGHREVVYDAHMEPVGDFVYRTLRLHPSEVAIDFQGTKPLSALKKYEYVVTPRECVSVISVYAYAFRPPEMNLMFPVSTNTRLVWHLAPTAAMLGNSRISASIERFNYFSGMRLRRRDLELIFIRAFVKRYVMKIQRLFKNPRRSGSR